MLCVRKDLYKAVDMTTSFKVLKMCTESKNLLYKTIFSIFGLNNTEFFGKHILTMLFCQNGQNGFQQYYLALHPNGKGF